MPQPSVNRLRRFSLSTSFSWPTNWPTWSLLVVLIAIYDNYVDPGCKLRRPWRRLSKALPGILCTPSIFRIIQWQCNIGKAGTSLDSRCVWWCNSEAIVSGPVSPLAGSALLLPVPPVFAPTYLSSPPLKWLTDEGIKASEHPFP